MPAEWHRHERCYMAFSAAHGVYRRSEIRRIRHEQAIIARTIARFETLLGHLNGILIYETFADGNEQYGRPSNPDFLLDRGELFERMRGRARVLAYEQKLLRGSNPAMVQRLAAYKSK